MEAGGDASPPASSRPLIPPRAGGKVPVPTEDAGPARRDPGPRRNSPERGGTSAAGGKAPGGLRPPHATGGGGKPTWCRTHFTDRREERRRARACGGPPAPPPALEQTQVKPLAAHRRSPPPGPPCSAPSPAPSRGTRASPPAPRPPLRPRVPAAAGQASRGASKRNGGNATAAPPPLCLPGEKSPGGPAQRHGRRGTG